MKHRLIYLLFAIMVTFLASARDLEQGYRGFIDWDTAIGNTDYPTQYLGVYKNANLCFLGLATSHGYQFNNHWFLGGGAMISVSVPSHDKFFPAFVNLRYDTKINKFTPFIDFRGGYYFNGGKSTGLYLSPTVGYCFKAMEKLNFNLGFGITIRGFTKNKYKHEGQIVTKIKSTTHQHVFLAARLGIDFK